MSLTARRPGSRWNWIGTGRLLVEGEAAYELGNVCDTCPFYFERLAGITEEGSPAVATVEALRSPVDQLSPSFLDTLSAIVPAGEYRACLLDVRPGLVWPGREGDYFTAEHSELFGFDSQWGLPHYPRTPYYRSETVALGEGEGLFEFVVPLVPPRYLDAETVTRYSSGSLPGAALALGVLDVKTPAIWHPDRGLPYPPEGYAPPKLQSHWCLVHYLLDGHHKTYAAADDGRPLRLVSLVALEAGRSTEADLARVLTTLRASAGVE